MTLTLGSLFAGIGGFDLAAEAMGWRTAWFVEWDANCRHWLAVNFPGIPIYGDITELDFTELEPVDILCGGFPCQPASAAGKRLGTADERWLWPHFARAIGTLRPRYVVAENVPGLLSVNGGRAFAEVLRDVAALGYDAEWSGLSAADVGAPQERERVWLVAYAEREPIRAAGRCGDAGAASSLYGATAERERVRVDDRAGSASVGSAASLGRERSRPARRRRDGSQDNGCALGYAERAERWTEASAAHERDRDDGGRNEASGRTRESSRLVGAWHDATPVRGADGTVRLIPREAAEAGPESPLWPVADGIPGRVARLRAIGNTAVPQCVLEGPFAVIASREDALTVGGAA